MTQNGKNAVARVLTRTEAAHLFHRFEEVHCIKEVDGKIVKCPGWDPNLPSVDEKTNEPTVGACQYKPSSRICTNLLAAANGQLVIEIRPRNEEDDRKEAQAERTILMEDLRKLRASREDIDEQIFTIEQKVKTL